MHNDEGAIWNYKEIIIGLIGGIAVDFDKTKNLLSDQLKKAGYETEYLKISEQFEKIEDADFFCEMYKKMQYGSFKRKESKEKDYWAREIIRTIVKKRQEKKETKRAFIIRSLKTKEELDLLNDIYGKNFIAIAIYLDEKKRKEALINRLKLQRKKRKEILSSIKKLHAFNKNFPGYDDLEISRLIEKINKKEDGDIKNCLADFLIEKDKKESDENFNEYGQGLEECFSFAHYFISKNKNEEKQIKRFIAMLFGYAYSGLIGSLDPL